MLVQICRSALVEESGRCWSQGAINDLYIHLGEM